MERLPDPDRMRCAATGHLLQATAASLGATGLGCALVAALALLLGAAPASAMLAILALVLPERVLALRLRFDAGLFDALARLPQATLHGLDDALHTLRLRTAVAVPRPLVDRIAGARRLAVWHAVVVLGQGILLALALASGGSR